MSGECDLCGSYEHVETSCTHFNLDGSRKQVTVEQTNKPEPGLSRFLVTGYAVIPVEVKVNVVAYDEITALRTAKELFTKKPELMRLHIVNGSEDEVSVHSFIPSIAEKLK